MRSSRPRARVELGVGFGLLRFVGPKRGDPGVATEECRRRSGEVQRVDAGFRFWTRASGHTITRGGTDFSPRDSGPVPNPDGSSRRGRPQVCGRGDAGCRGAGARSRRAREGARAGTIDTSGAGCYVPASGGGSPPTGP